MRAWILFTLYAILVSRFGRMPIIEMDIKWLLDGFMFTDPRDNIKIVIVLM